MYFQRSITKFEFIHFQLLVDEDLSHADQTHENQQPHRSMDSFQVRMQPNWYGRFYE